MDDLKNKIQDEVHGVCYLLSIVLIDETSTGSTKSLNCGEAFFWDKVWRGILDCKGGVWFAKQVKLRNIM